MNNRLRLVRNELNKTQAEMEELLELPKMTWSRYERGVFAPSAEVMAKLADRLNINLNYLTIGEGSIFISDNAYKLNLPDSSSEMLSIPLYDVRASAGNGNFIDNENIETPIIIDRNYIKNFYGYTPSKIAAIYAKGDSMEPTILDKDILLIDLEQYKVNSGIYIVRYNDELFVKRLSAMPQKIEVISDNKSYKTFEITESDDFKVIGKVIGYFRCWNVK